MREDTDMEHSGCQGRPGSPAAPLGRPARALAAGRAILRPRVGALSWAGSRLLAGAILVAGLLARALFGWRWWLVVIVLTVAGEAILVCSTLARTPEREELVDELLAALAPGRRARRLARLEAERFRAAPFALYGLPPSWPGPRFLGRRSSTRPRRGPELTTSLQLGHGDRGATGGSLLLVEAAPWTSAAGPEPSRRREASRRVEIPVDGVPVGFEVSGDGRRWTARGEHGAVVLRLEGRDLDPARVSLVRVADLSPYLAGPGARQLAPGP
jgi:hypothetical protein